MGESGRKAATNDLEGETSFGCGLCAIRALGGSPHCARIYIRCQILFTLKKQAEVVSLTAVRMLLFYPGVEGRGNGRQRSWDCGEKGKENTQI